MDPKKLLYMKSVVDSRSLSKAAKMLQVSQPALSISMKRLETSLGVKLLERGPHGVVPTAAGEMLYARASFIQDEIDIAKHQIEHRNHPASQQLSAGAIVSLTTKILPMALCSWRQVCPETPLRIVASSYPELFLSLMRSDLDFIFAQTGCSELSDGLRQRVLFRDQLVVFARRGHPVLDGTVTWRALAKYPWVTHLVWRQSSPIEQVMQDEGIGAIPQFTECSSVSFMKSVIENSDHLGMLPSHTLEDDVARGNLVALSIKSPMMSRNIAVFFRERTVLDDASRGFIEQVAEIGTRLCKETEMPLQ